MIRKLFVQEVVIHYIKYIVIFFRNSDLTSPSESSIFSNTPEQEGINWWAGFLVRMTRGMHRWMGTRRCSSRDAGLLSCPRRSSSDSLLMERRFTPLFGSSDYLIVIIAQLS